MTLSSAGPGRAEHLVLPGVLTAEQAAATVAGLLAIQRPDGSIPWFRGHHLDPWDHVEAAMALDAAGEHHAARPAYGVLVAAAVGLMPAWTRRPLRLPWLPVSGPLVTRTLGTLATATIRWALTPPPAAAAHTVEAGAR